MNRYSPDVWLPKLLLAPSFLISLVFVYGFIIWTSLISLTKSRLMPQWEFVGIDQYLKLLENDRWLLACKNLMIFGGLFILLAIVIGLLLAILLDQKIRAEGFLRTIYLYPMALSFIVTGTAWKWILNPDSGIQRWFHDLGFTGFSFEWLIDPETERVIGCGLVGPGAGELIAEAVLAIEMGCEVHDITESIHPHPTLSETVAFAAEAFDGTLTDLYIPKKRKR